MTQTSFLMSICLKIQYPLSPSSNIHTIRKTNWSHFCLPLFCFSSSIFLQPVFHLSLFFPSFSSLSIPSLFSYNSFLHSLLLSGLAVPRGHSVVCFDGPNSQTADLEYGRRNEEVRVGHRLVLCPLWWRMMLTPLWWEAWLLLGPAMLKPRAMVL